MRVFVGCSAGLVASTLLLLSLPAAAQDSATAGALFDRGVADMEAGRFESGCPALEESQRVEPRPGTLFALADCERKWGRVASAVAHYQDYLGVVSRLPPEQQKRHRDRAKLAETALAEIKPTVPLLTLALPAGAPEGTIVERDGTVVQGAALGVPLPVNPGSHRVVTRVPGGAPREVQVSLALGESRRLELELTTPSSAAKSAPEPQPAGTAVAVAPAPQDASDARDTAPSAKQSSQRTWGYIVGGVGVAGVITGSVTGILVLGKKGTVNEECDGHVCSAPGVKAANSGQSLATVSTIAFGVGAAGIATGVILLLTAPSSHAKAGNGVRPLVVGGAHGAWAGVTGRF